MAPVCVEQVSPFSKLLPIENLCHNSVFPVTLVSSPLWVTERKGEPKTVWREWEAMSKVLCPEPTGCVKFQSLHLFPGTVSSRDACLESVGVCARRPQRAVAQDKQTYQNIWLGTRHVPPPLLLSGRMSSLRSMDFCN